MLCARNILTVLRETLTQYITGTFNRRGDRGVCTLVLVLVVSQPVLSCIDLSVKVGPLLIFFISLVSSDTTKQNLRKKLDTVEILPLRTSAMTARPRPSCEDSDKIPRRKDLYLSIFSISLVSSDTTKQNI
jgi:hypothetical protein